MNGIYLGQLEINAIKGVSSLPFACMTRIPEDPGNGRCSDHSQRLKFSPVLAAVGRLKLASEVPKLPYDAVTSPCGVVTP